MKNYEVAQLNEIPAVPCPCGAARRAFSSPDNRVATVHLVEIKKEAERHHHQQMTEFYVVLEGEGFLELDGEMISVKPLTAVMIKPGCRHRAIGNLKILNIPVPAFNPKDEFLD